MEKYVDLSDLVFALKDKVGSNNALGIYIDFSNRFVKKYYDLEPFNSYVSHRNTVFKRYVGMYFGVGRSTRHGFPQTSKSSLVFPPTTNFFGVNFREVEGDVF